MARLSKIAGYVIAAVVVLTIVLSEIAERKEAADINAAFDDLLASLTKICVRLELEKLNHITRSPWIVAATIPQPWEIPQPYHRTPGDCEPDWATIGFEEAGSIYFDLIHGHSSCTITSEKPASALASQTTAYISEQPASPSKFPRETGLLSGG
jgi:hypothetical protein